MMFMAFHSSPGRRPLLIWTSGALLITGLLVLAMGRS